MPTRAERAERLRPLIERIVKDETVRGAAKRIGISSSAVHNFVTGTTPQEDTLTRLERWAESVRSDETQDAPDPWVGTMLELVRFAGGERPMTDAERRLVQRDVLEGIIRLGRSSGKDVRMFERMMRELEAQGLPAPQPPGSLGAGTRGFSGHPLFEILQIDAIAADKRADAAKDLAAAARIEAEEMQARRLTLSEEEIAAAWEIAEASVHGQETVEAADRQALESTRTPAPPGRRGLRRPGDRAQPGPSQ